MAAILAKCPCCKKFSELEEHHLVPYSVFSRMGLSISEKHQYKANTIHVCRDCHIVIHWAATNKELAERFNTRKLVIELVNSKREAFTKRNQDKEPLRVALLDPEIVEKYEKEFMALLA
jgi:hypothetical protein